MIEYILEGYDKKFTFASILVLCEGNYEYWILIRRYYFLFHLANTSNMKIINCSKSSHNYLYYCPSENPLGEEKEKKTRIVDLNFLSRCIICVCVYNNSQFEIWEALKQDINLPVVKWIHWGMLREWVPCLCGWIFEGTTEACKETRTKHSAVYSS